MALFCCIFVLLFQTLLALNVRSHRTPYYWPHARGQPEHYSTADFKGPSNLSSLAWSWHHPEGRYHTVVTSAALIDDKKNLFLASEDGVRKFSTDGQELWYYKPRGPIASSASIMDGAIFVNTQNGFVFALDMETGAELWAKKHADSSPGDTNYVEAYHGIVVSGVDSPPGGGARRVLGVDAKTGDKLWDYVSTELLWNFHPQFTGDDAFVAMDIHGGVYKWGLHNGTLLWQTHPSQKSSLESFTDGGVILGPDGTSYTCSNFEGGGQVGQRGAVRALALTDGRLLWEQILDKPCNSWPVVASNNKIVFVTSGAFVASPAAGNDNLRKTFQKDPQQMHDFSLSLGGKELDTYGWPNKTATLVGFKTETGTPVWRQDLEPYGRLAAAGDEEGFFERLRLRHRDQCLPAQFGAPTLSSDGTIYVGRADGNLYAVKDHTVTTYQTGAGFLHPGASFAPGLMAITSCDGLFVWKV